MQTGSKWQATVMAVIIF